MQKIDRDRKMLEPLLLQISELQQANKALSLQTEVLSGAYETSQKRVKELEAAVEISQAEQLGLRQAFCDAKMEIMDLKMDKAEKAELMKTLETCRKWFFLHAPTAVLPDTNGQEAHRYIADKFFVNPADLNEV